MKLSAQELKHRAALRAEAARLAHLQQSQPRRSARLAVTENPGYARMLPSVAAENRGFDTLFFCIPFKFSLAASSQVDPVTLTAQVDPDADFIAYAINVRSYYTAAPDVPLFSGRMYFTISDPARDYTLGQRIRQNVSNTEYVPGVNGQTTVMNYSLQNVSGTPSLCRYTPLAEPYQFMRNTSIWCTLDKNFGIAVATDVYVTLIGWKDYSK